MSREVKFVNLTPHTVTVVGEDGKKILEVPPSGQVARVEVVKRYLGGIRVGRKYVPVVRSSYGEVQGLPDRCDNCYNYKTLCSGAPFEAASCVKQDPKQYFIVSLIVLQALQGKRKDVVAPDTSPAGAVRDEEGRIIGVRAFVVP